jgi:hypothetical protein
MKKWLWTRRRNRAEYWLHCLAQQGDDRASRAWYELVGGNALFRESNDPHMHDCEHGFDRTFCYCDDPDAHLCVDVDGS